jgi:hypothetical protein
MISLTADQQAHLARRVCPADVYAQWQDDADADTYFDANTSRVYDDGVSATYYSPTSFRLEELQFRSRIPYLGAGLDFPSAGMAAAYPPVGKSANPFWYDRATGTDGRAAQQSPICGGRLRLFAELFIGARAEYVKFADVVVVDPRLTGAPRRIEVNAIALIESLTRRHVDVTIYSPSAPASAYDVSTVLANALSAHDVTDYCLTPVGGGPRDSEIVTQLVPPSDTTSLLSPLDTLAMHDGLSFFVDANGTLRLYNWFPETYSYVGGTGTRIAGRSPDVTITESTIVRDSATLVPRLDRLGVNLRISGTNTYHTSAPYTYSWSDGATMTTYFGSYRTRNWSLNSYAYGVGTIAQRAFRNAFASYDQSETGINAVPTQFRCSVPFRIGMPIELGDCVSVRYEPCGLHAYSRWVVEEKNFRFSSMTFDLVMHDRL